MIDLTNKKIDVQKEKDGTFTAFLEDAPVGWTLAKTKEDAILGLISLYPEVKTNSNIIK